MWLTADSIHLSYKKQIEVICNFYLLFLLFNYYLGLIPWGYMANTIRPYNDLPTVGIFHYSVPTYFFQSTFVFIQR